MKKIGITFIVLLVLIGIYAIGKRSLYTEGPKETGDLEKALEQVSFDSIAEIRLRKGTGPEVVLKKKEGEWVVDSAWGYAARVETVKRLTDALRRLRPIEVAGRFADSHPGFEVGDEKGAFVTLVDAAGKTVLKLVAGKNADLWQDGYVRLADEPTVYKAKPNLRSDGNLYSVENTSWVDKKIQELETGEEVTKVEVAGEAGTWTLVKEEIEVPAESKEDAAAKGGGEPAEETPAPEEKAAEETTATDAAEAEAGAADEPAAEGTPPAPAEEAAETPAEPKAAETPAAPAPEEPKAAEPPAAPEAEEEKAPETRKETHWYIITEKERFEPES
ncbi:MAG: DUF4340 domain-containing protein, partial [Planctomycetes bacterium]|nr:DUF4340 domain-containing protein [Planctomycetota bacterium]